MNNVTDTNIISHTKCVYVIRNGLFSKHVEINYKCNGLLKTLPLTLCCKCKQDYLFIYP